jgi:hypothetical protein
MKPTILSFVSLALILIGMNAGYPKNELTKGPGELHKASVSYEVNIHVAADYEICNNYLIQITDEKGRIVAPSQIYKPGVTRYNFHEQGPIRGKSRIVMLVGANYPQHFACANDLYAAPASRGGPFLYGHTYSFDLYPVPSLSNDVKKE